NPYKVLFVAPFNWVENVMIRLNALFRDWTGRKTLDQILEVEENPEELWREIGENELIRDTFGKEWGVGVEKHGVQIRKVDMPPEYQEAAAKEKKQELEAAGRAAETVGTVLAMMAYSRGITIKKIQEEIQGDTEKQKEFLVIAKDLVTRKIGIEGGSYLDIRVQGAEGLERMFLNALSAWQRMPQGKSPKK
ncbi:hypothetical protein KJ854_00590, partial [Patescibacteria group bacterium]|nr:hypothetical protein [Patescibacteria group bacterium]